jgi:drug/metabolite transporter (DMT)-like permease
MLLGSLAFASMGTLVHALGRACDWQVIALARSSLPLVLVAVFALAAGVKLVLWRPRTLWIRSIAGSISLVSTFFALTRLPLSDVFTLTNMFPVWVAVLSWPVLREPPSAGVWLAIASGVAGVVLIQQPHLAAGNPATLFALAASLCTAVAMIGLHRLRHIDIRAIVVHFSGVALLFSGASFFLFDRPAAPRTELGGSTLFLLLCVGLAATIGQIFLTKAFVAGPPAKVSVVGLTQIVFAMALDVLIFKHHFSPASLAGIVLVVAPTAWLLAQPPARSRPGAKDDFLELSHAPSTSV